MGENSNEGEGRGGRRLQRGRGKRHWRKNNKEGDSPVAGLNPWAQEFRPEFPILAWTPAVSKVSKVAGSNYSNVVRSVSNGSKGSEAGQSSESPKTNTPPHWRILSKTAPYNTSSNLVDYNHQNDLAQRDVELGPALLRPSLRYNANVRKHAKFASFASTSKASQSTTTAVTSLPMTEDLEDGQTQLYIDEDTGSLSSSRQSALPLRQYADEEIIQTLFDKTHTHSLDNMFSASPGIASRKMRWKDDVMSVFHIAVLNQLSQAVHYAIRAGCNVDEREHKSKMTAMHMACLSGNLALVKLLYREGGASFVLKDKLGELPIHKAVRSRSVDLVKYLLQTSQSSSFKINTRNKSRQTALMIATITSQREIVQTLLMYGSDAFLADKNGMDCVCHAAKVGDASVLKALLNCNFVNSATNFHSLGINQQNSISAMHCAVLGGSTACLRILMDVGYSVNERDEQGTTSLMLACSLTRHSDEIIIDIIRILTNKSSQLVSHQCQRGFFALTYATIRANRDIFRAILSKTPEAIVRVSTERAFRDVSSIDCMKRMAMLVPELLTSGAVFSGYLMKTLLKFNAQADLAKMNVEKLTTQNCNDSFNIRVPYPSYDYCDVDINLNGGERLHAHSFVLASCIWFRTFFDSGFSHMDNFQDTKQFEISAEQYSPDAYKMFISWLYSHSSGIITNLEQDSLIQLLFLSNEYLCEELQLICEIEIGKRILNDDIDIEEEEIAEICRSLNLHHLPLCNDQEAFGDVATMVHTESWLESLQDLSEVHWTCLLVNSMPTCSEADCDVYMKYRIIEAYNKIYEEKMRDGQKPIEFSRSYAIKCYIDMKKAFNALHKENKQMLPYCEEKNSPVVLGGYIPSILCDASFKLSYDASKYTKIEQSIAGLLSGIFLETPREGLDVNAVERDEIFIRMMKLLVPDECKFIELRIQLLHSINPHVEAFDCSCLTKKETMIPGVDFDAKISIKGEKLYINIHKAILAASSSKFLAMIRFQCLARDGIKTFEDNCGIHNFQSVHDDVLYLELETSSVHPNTLPVFVFFIYAGFIPNLNYYAKDIDIDEILMNLLFISEEFLMDELRCSTERLLIRRLNIDNSPSIFMAVKDSESNQKLALACAIIIMREVRSVCRNKESEQNGESYPSNDCNFVWKHANNEHVASSRNAESYEVSSDQIFTEVLEYIVSGNG